MEEIMLQMSAYQIFHSGYMFHSPADNAGLQPRGDGGASYREQTWMLVGNVKSNP